MQIFYEFVAVILDKQVVTLAYIFGRYGVCYGFAVVGGVELVCALPYKAVRKVLYPVNFIKAVAQIGLPTRAVLDMKVDVEITVEHIARFADGGYLFAYNQFLLYLLAVVKVELCVVLQKVRVFGKGFTVCLLRSVLDYLIGYYLATLVVRLCCCSLVPETNYAGIFALFALREIFICLYKLGYALRNFAPFQVHRQIVVGVLLISACI